MGGSIFLALGLDARKKIRCFKEAATYTTATILKYDHEMILDTSLASAVHRPASTVYMPTIRFEVNGIEKIVRTRRRFNENIKNKFPVGSIAGIYYLENDLQGFEFASSSVIVEVFIVIGGFLLLWGVGRLIQALLQVWSLL